MTEVVDVEVQEEGAELIPYRGGSLMPEIIKTPEQIKADLERIYQVLHEYMRPGVDYMEIQGRKSLTQAGAERTMRFFGMGALVKLVAATENWPVNPDDKGFVSYTYSVGVGPITPNGVVPVAWCEGSANSQERKYKNVPVYEIANTLRKMAQKRGLTGAVRRGTGTSEFWSDDLEDLPAEMLRQEKSKPIPTPMSGPDEPGDTVMPWGNKHKGQTLSQILAEDPGYIKWLKKSLDEKEAKGDLPEDQVYLKSAVNLIVENM